MYKFLIILVCSVVFVSGCGQNTDAPKSDTKGKEEAVDAKKNTEEDTQSSDEEKSDEKEPNKEDNNQESDTTSVSKNTSEDFFTLEKTSIEPPFGDDGDLKFEHTEQDIVEEFMDENGRIYFDLDDDPIRNITSADGKISHITNYGDAFINIMEAEAYNLSTQEEMDQAYALFISNPPAELADKDPSEYRNWEEATNLERGIMQIVYSVAPLLNDLGYLIENDMYSNEAFEPLNSEFEKLKSPDVVIPAPQTPLDKQLFENMQQIQSLWGLLGQFETPEENKAEFQKLYNHIRGEMNNVIVRVNFTLSEEPFGANKDASD